MMDQEGTIVIGLDGAHFELIEPWLDAGQLPNIAAMIEEGVSSELQSVLPPVTSPNWKSYSTGKNPGKIGVFWWENIDVSNKRVHYPAHRKHHNTEFWEIIAEEGGGAGVVNVPTTYPPKEIDPFCVAGAPDGENRDFTYPPELEEDLRNDFNYRVTKRLRIKDDTERAAEEILDLIDLRFRIAEYLLLEYNPAFLQVTTFYLNSLHHFLWNGDHTRHAWEIVDEHVGNLRETGRDVVLMSDHGSTEINTVFHVNSWLEREGYLRSDTETSDYLYRFGVNTDRLVRLATKLQVRDLAERFVSEWITHNIPDEQGEMSREQKTDIVDWEASDALASGQGPVYLLREGDHRNSLQSELRERLADLTDPKGRPIADSVYRGEDVYEGTYMNEAPAIVIDQASGVHIAGGIGRDAVFTDPVNSAWRAENKRYGLFVGAGPSFGRGGLSDMSILDLAPTLLHLHNCRIPNDMDGEVRRDVFASDVSAAEREPVFRNPDITMDEAAIRRVARRTDI